MKIFIATKNKHKLKELERILKPFGIETVSENDLSEDLPEVDETGTSYEENALLKAQSGLRVTGLPTIADDSGLSVDALDGAPGLYSARYSGGSGDDAANNEKLLNALKGLPKEKRTATFVSSIICLFPNGETITAYGECKGYIGFEPKGESGFGYDPLFVTENGTFAELSADEKDAISHRGNALRAFKVKLENYFKEV